MDLFDPNTILFAGKWAFIGLIYMILMLVVIAVRREIATHTQSSQTVKGFSPGYLHVLNPGGDLRLKRGASLALQSTTSLGAEIENDIVLGDSYVSGYHARLSWDGSAWWIEDLGSTNGTRLDGTPCPPHIPRPLASGARLELGDIVFELRT